MSFAPFGRLDTEPIYKYFNILNVDDTFLLETGKLIYKFKNSLIPSDIINSLFSLSRDSPSRNSRYNLRTRSNFSSVPHELLSIYVQKSIRMRTQLVWNAIPLNIKSCESLPSFKAQYKKHLLLDYSDS